MHVSHHWLYGAVCMHQICLLNRCSICWSSSEKEVLAAVQKWSFLCHNPRLCLGHWPYLPAATRALQGYTATKAVKG
jgi:hypothetical protein